MSYMAMVHGGSAWLEGSIITSSEMFCLCNNVPSPYAS